MQQQLAASLDFWRFLLKRFVADRSIHNAAALTYTTLFAVVPVMTLTFAMLSAVPAFQDTSEQIQHFLLGSLVPSDDGELQAYLQGFTRQARQLTWVGVLLLAVTAFFMLVTLEKTFNAIWRVRQPRRGVSSFLLYWALLSLGPLLLGAAFAITTYIASLSLLSGPDALIGAGTFWRFAPLLFSAAAFTLIYSTVPNTRVPIGHALLGGVCVAVLLEVAKKLFGLFVSAFPGYQLIYGAFATVPLFLLWVYLSWLVVLLGAELVCSLSLAHQWQRRVLPRLVVLLGVLQLFHERQKHGRPLNLRHVQRAGWPLPEPEWEELVDFLEREHLVSRAAGDNWVLCRDLSDYSMQRLLSRSPWPLPRPQQLPEHFPASWYADLRQALLQLQQQQKQIFAASLRDWLHGDGRPGETPSEGSTAAGNG